MQPFLQVNFYFWSVSNRNLGLGEHIIIKGGARFTTEYLAENLSDFDKNEFLENLYSSHYDDQILEFGFISVCRLKGMKYLCI